MNLPAIIPLRNSEEYFEVSPVDYPRFQRYKWYLHRTGYPVRYVRAGNSLRVLYAHRLAMGVSRGQFRGYVVDHIDGNTLNNRRDNLRVVTRKENARNRRKMRRENKTSQYKGVYEDKWIKGAKRWKAQICIEGRMTHLGRYDTEEEAARAYDRAALENWGVYAHTNFPAVSYSISVNSGLVEVAA